MTGFRRARSQIPFARMTVQSTVSLWTDYGRKMPRLIVLGNGVDLRKTHQWDHFRFGFRNGVYAEDGTDDGYGTDDGDADQGNSRRFKLFVDR